MNKNKLLILFILRILIFGLFMMSGILKLYPSIVPFEKQLVDLGFVDWCSAPYMARLIIALEIALGIGFLQSNYLKRFVIPATAFLLLVFCVHLSIVIYTQGANSGNCGCFGQLIPMTPLQALLKNIVTLGILGYMYIIYKEKERNNYLVLITIYLLSSLALFMLFPFGSCNVVKADSADESLIVKIDSLAKLKPDTNKVDTIAKVVDSKPLPGDALKNAKVDTTKNVVPVAVVDAICPVKKISSYASFKKFSDGSVVDLDNGRKIVNLFNVECEHCMETAKKLGELSRRKTIPPVYILFWGSEDQVENFFKVAQCRFPYKVIDASIFFQLLGNAPSPPKVVYLCNGNIVTEYDSGTFTIEKLEETVSK